MRRGKVQYLALLSAAKCVFENTIKLSLMLELLT